MEVLHAESNEFAHLKNNDLSASNASSRSSTVDEDDDDDRFSNVSVNDDKRSKLTKREEIGSSTVDQPSANNNFDYSRQRLAKELKDYEDRWLAHRNFLLYTQALNMKVDERERIFGTGANLYNPAPFPTYPWPSATTTNAAPTPIDSTQQPRSPSSDDSGNQSNSGSTTEWTFEEQFRQLYELSDEPKRKEFLDDLFAFMQKRATPVNRIPIMAKHVLDLYELFRLVVGKGGLVEVINKKLWREVTKGLNLPSSITSAAFTLRTQYMKYLYPYECEKLQLSSPTELQAAIEGNRREGRRPSYAFDYSSPPQIMPPPPPPPPPGSSSVSNAFLQTSLASRSMDQTSGHDAMQHAAIAAAAALSHHPFFLAAAAASSRDGNHSTVRIPTFDEHNHHHHHHLSSPSNRSSIKRSLSPLFLCKSISEETNGNESTKKLAATTMINPNFNTRSTSSSFTPVGTTPSLLSPANKLKLIAKENNFDTPNSVVNDQKSIQISIELNGISYQGTLFACTTPPTHNKD